VTASETSVDRKLVRIVDHSDDNDDDNDVVRLCEASGRRVLVRLLEDDLPGRDEGEG
jgi:hypothetical protein